MSQIVLYLEAHQDSLSLIKNTFEKWNIIIKIRKMIWNGTNVSNTFNISLRLWKINKTSNLFSWLIAEIILRIKWHFVHNNQTSLQNIHSPSFWHLYLLSRKRIISSPSYTIFIYPHMIRFTCADISFHMWLPP